MPVPRSIDEYLDLVPAKQRAALLKLRKAIHAAAPQAEECISYQLPAFRQGRMLVGFGATAKHCAFYLMSSTVLQGLEQKLEGYDISKGTIRFQPETPLPSTLVRRLVKARLAEIARAAQVSGSGAGKTKPRKPRAPGER